VNAIGLVGAEGFPRDDLAAALRAKDAHVVTVESVNDLKDTPPVGALVWIGVDLNLSTPRKIADLEPDAWRAAVETPLRRFVGFLQAAHRQLREHGGHVVVVVPSIAMTGAAQLVPWATVADGQRALAKSVARVWGAEGITVNCVAAPAELLASAAGLSRPDLQRPALADPGIADLAGVVAALTSPALAAVSGATIGVDGGRWMAP
jgi:3-oxoacyl-[acyl-carrier protein] reductase